MSESKVRVRYAPSPTGYLHVGGVRALLFNWLYAKKTGGKLILRIEDTDQARSTRESEKMVLEDIKKLGLTADEGPEEGGNYGPYRQSERFDIYAKMAKQLLDNGKAYYCFCSADLITQKRQAALKMGKIPHYDGTCRKISREEAEKRIAAGEKAGLRFIAPNKSFHLDDVVRGRVEFQSGTVGDFLITRSPTGSENEIISGIGMPVYNFACVIDDHLMEMTHIIRGEDHLSNTARQLMIYDGFGWKTPIFAHTAMVLGPDKQKLSKRNGDTSTHEYLEKGYLPDTLVNFLALLGWWPPQGFEPKSGHPEVLTREELIQVFSLEGLQKSAAVFDVAKLNWMNGFYIKAMPIQELVQLAKPFFENHREASEALKGRDDRFFEVMLDIVRTEVQLLNELPEAARVIWEEHPELEAEAKAILKSEEAKNVVQIFESEMSQGKGDLTEDEISALQKSVQKQTGAKGKALFMPIRALVTGKTHGPELKRILPLIGRQAVLNRMKTNRERALS